MIEESVQLPANTGVSLKAKHYQLVLETLPQVGWFEIHPENYMGRGGLPHKYLGEIRNHYSLSMHGVGMSLGSADGIGESHLKALSELVNRYQPAQVSEHISWSRINGVFLNDLLPLPYHRESLDTLSNNIDKVQNTLRRTLLVENPSSYVDFSISTWSEPEFLRELVLRTGCGLLLDVNNIYVSASNQGFDPYEYLSKVPLEAVAEIHLAGHAVQSINKNEIRIDDHGSPVTDSVWKLHEVTLGRLGKPRPVLIEWDTDVPEFEVLFNEARKSEAMMNKLFGAEGRTAAA